MFGFSSQYWGPPRPTEVLGYNHTSANTFPDKVAAYITKELDEQALIGPFDEPPFEWVHYSPFMTRPKAAQEGNARRVIVDLSFPKGDDINSCITKNILDGNRFTHNLPTIDDLVDVIRAMDFDAYVYAVDIARAYRNFRSDPLDWPLMGIAFSGELLIDTALPFRARNSSFYMQKIAEFLARALAQRGVCVLSTGYTTISRGAKADMRWFMDFLPEYNGVSMIPEATPSAIVEADSCTKGGGAVCGAACYIVQYDPVMASTHHISQLEAMNCMAAIRILINSNSKGKVVEVHCDNSAAVSI